jgi:lysophospholipase L1-like esterase
VSLSLRPSRPALAALAAAGAMAAAVAAPAQASPAKVGPPTVMTALGDSITRGFHTGLPLQDVPANSWATGTNTTVNSVCLRIQALNPAMKCGANNPPNGGNDAVTGAKVAGTLAQAQNAAARSPKPDLVMILIGANDVCASSPAAMTSTASFESSFRTTMAYLSANLPDARIQVSSIPNIFNLWNVGRVSASARLAWGLFSVCQSMLANPTSTAQADVDRRNAVKARNEAFNDILKNVCGEYVHCRFDNYAAYNFAFALSDLSTIDFFHPNVQGQAKAASLAWNAGPNYADTTAPATTISRDRAADGSDDWYRDSVTVTLGAGDPDDAVAGSEYFYKLDGAQDKPWTKYTGPFTVSDEGLTDVVARSVDSNGNIEASKTDVIKIDRTAPSFDLACPAGPYELGSSQAATVANAADDRSGFAEDPNGARPIDTSQPGDGQPNVVEIQDRAGNTAQRSCTYDVHYPVPGAPALTAGASPNATGVFTLAWTGADPGLFGIRYTLQHKDADDADYSDVAAALAARSHAFTPGAAEGEGTWTYRVAGADEALGLLTPASPPSDPVKVDRSAPAAPSFTADRAPDYAGGGGWFRDTVTVGATDDGDPALQDGSAGSGVDPASVPGPVTRSTSGAHTIGGTVADRAGNTSAPGSLTVQVDATAPSLSVTCPAAVLLHSAAAATIAASDAESGLAADPSQTVALATGAVGPQITSATATDNVGHSTSRSCTTAVQYLYGGLTQPVNPDGSSIFKLNSTVPVKFHLTDVRGDGVAGATARLELAKVSDDVEGLFEEAVSTAASTTGNLFRDQGGGDYQFNLATKPLSTGTWMLKVVLDDGAEYRTRISLR